MTDHSPFYATRLVGASGLAVGWDALPSWAADGADSKFNHAARVLACTLEEAY